MASLFNEVDKPFSGLDGRRRDTLDDEEAEIGAGPQCQFSAMVPIKRDLSISQ